MTRLAAALCLAAALLGGCAAAPCRADGWRARGYLRVSAGCGAGRVDVFVLWR